MAKKEYDVVVVGGGHNGLVAAAYLCRAGLDTLVVEKHTILGGCSVTEEDIFPGYKISSASYVASLFHPTIIKDLNLYDHGLEFLERDPPSFTPFKNGSHLFSCLRLEDTQREIAQFSPKDAEKYAEYEATLTRISELVDPLLLMTPPAPDSNSLPQLWDILKLGRAARKLDGDFLTALQLTASSVADFVNGWFESEELKSTLATDGIIGAYAGVESPGTAYVLLHHVMGGITDKQGTFHRGRWAYVRGGMGEIPQSIVRSVRAGGYPLDIVTGEAVKRIAIENGEVTGVELANGDFINSRTVVSGVDPKITYQQLIDSEHLQAEFLTQIDHYKVNGATVKVNLVLSELPDFTACPGVEAGPQHTGTIHICESLAYMEQAWEDAKHGRASSDPVLDCTIPTVCDPSLLPPEHPDHHIVNIFAMYGPKELIGGNWTEEGPRFLDRIIAKLAEYAPNVPDAIVHRQIITPDDLERRYSLTGGCIFHGTMSLDQLFWARPLPSIARYRGPLGGLYMCGAGTHPGGGVTGIPGLNASREILRDSSTKPR